jgi:tetratricopeptide (TPR) repeat protein
MPTTEIEKLERRYAENPQGLTFAPLAEVHRKNGDVARALELLSAGLELHPNYIPASIVLGRCHWDLGDLPAAESAFSHVLRLDDENVIALKSLADINERLERYNDAQRWLNRLISVDRSNEEARQQLARIEAAKQAPGKAAELPPEIAVADPEPTKEVVPQPGEASVDLTEALEPAASEPKPAVLEFIDTTSEPAKETAAPAPVSEEAKAEHEERTAEEPAAVDGLISQEFVPPSDTAYRSHPELTQEFISARDPVDQFEVETASEVELRSSGAAEFRVPNAAEDFMEAEPHEAPAAELDLIRPEPVPQRVPQPERPSYSVQETKGQSVAAFFRAMLAARPAGAVGSSGSSPAQQPEASIRPSAPDPSLQQTTDAGEDRPATPAIPSAGNSSELAVTFDDFFGAPAGGSGPAAKKSTDPGKDDLDEFQSWLQNLKR